MNPNAFLVHKTVTTGPRFAFFAGLESSGHHLMVEWLNSFVGSGVTLGGAFSRHLFHGYKSELGLFSATRAESASRLAKLFVRALRRSELPAGTVVPLNGCPTRRACPAANRSSWFWSEGMMSYPNFGGADKVLRWGADLPVLARLVDADAQRDLRIVVLLREPRSLLASVLREAHYPSPHVAIRSLTLQLALLHGQLRLLDRSFVACFDFDEPLRLGAVSRHLFGGKAHTASGPTRAALVEAMRAVYRVNRSSRGAQHGSAGDVPPRDEPLSLWTTHPFGSLARAHAALRSDICSGSGES